VRWTVLEPVKLALLDERFLLTVRRWPEIVAALFERVAVQSMRLGTHRALCQLPRVEDRLHALLWFLAERWGRVSPQGVVLPIKLTQEVIGQLIGAKRPTVSLAIKELEARGTVLRRGDGAWLLEEAWASEEAPVELTLLSASFVRHDPAPLSGRRLADLVNGNGHNGHNGHGENGGREHGGSRNGNRLEDGSAGMREIRVEPPVPVPAFAELRQRIERIRERHEQSVSEVSALLARSAEVQQRSAEVRDCIASGRRRRAN
jgi:hypothetical protein